MSVVALRGVSFAYNGARIVDDVSFGVEAGTFVGLVGPNGAGKTTLIRLAMDILRPDRGSVSLFGDPPGLHRDRIGYLPEERGLYRREKVATVLAYFGQLKGLTHRTALARAREWIGRVGLEDVSGWIVERLSKGMAQRVTSPNG